MKVSEPAQELLEQLWIAVEEDAQSGLRLPLRGGAPAEAEELVRQGYAMRGQDCLLLTEAGKPQAEQAVRRHRLAERLLADVLSSSGAQIDTQACQLEHALFEGVDEAICTLLGHPQFCPHGKPIPPGECCLQGRKQVDRLIAPLVELQAGQRGTIAYLRMGDGASGEAARDSKQTQKLTAMGVLPGVSITLLRRSPSFVFEAGYSQFAVDESIAADIYVRLAGK
jgi:DtxR family Mn-dependent transcriptional regulator